MYDPPEHDATALIFYGVVLFTMGESADAAVAALEHTRELIVQLGLGEDRMFPADAETGRVADFIKR